MEDIQQAVGGISDGSWVDASIGAATVGMDALGTVLDPVGSLVSMGVGWLIEHVQPLSEALDWLAGDPDQITAYAQTWGNIATHTADAATELTDAVQREAAPWSGVAAEAYRVHAGDHVTALQGIAEAAAGIGEAVQGAAELVATVRTIVRDLIAECVATLAARVPQWLAMEGFTLGIATPVVVSQVAAVVSRWVARITRFLDGLIRSLANLIPLLRRLGDLIGELKALLARLARTDPTTPRAHDGGPDAPRDPDRPGDGPVDLEARMQELGFDPATGRYRHNEAETALRVEAASGVTLSRAEPGQPYDWIDQDGRTYDAVGNFPSQHFDQQWPNVQARIRDHLTKADYVPVDVSRFTDEQARIVSEFINDPANGLVPRVFVVTD